MGGGGLRDRLDLKSTLQGVAKHVHNAGGCITNAIQSSLCICSSLCFNLSMNLSVELVWMCVPVELSLDFWLGEFKLQVFKDHKNVQFMENITNIRPP